MATDTETERRLLESGVSALERAGYRVERPMSGALPDAIGVCDGDGGGSNGGEGGSNGDGDDGGGGDGDDGGGGDGNGDGDTGLRVGVEPLPTADADPTFVLSRLSNDASNGRFTLFVVEDDAGARACTDVLESPPFVRDEDELGRRTFYDGPGRVALDGGRYALHRSDDPNLRWTEEGTDDEKRLVLRDSGRGGSGGDGGDGEDGGDTGDGEGGDDEVVAVLPNVDALRAPDAGTFRYSYAREADKRIRVRTADGREAGAYSGFAAMRRDAYVPVPMPLVPEHLFAGAGSARREWAILVADEGHADGGEGSPRLLGPAASVVR
ncbi:hypothetical protein [Halopelagius fulvigenes]|uniref:Uncharacterized protein n=1 Tax=Halopelagius fulvigenes TaxID=1198324 RepID=A0ABD5TXF4_9EURY